jgi:glycosyltransferase involved in cell wall biosynthesis
MADGGDRKKILIITYYWPPAGGAGVQRWLKFVKYMRNFGWEPVVYTALGGEMPVIDNSLEKDIPPNLTVLKKPIREPYSVYKRLTGRKKDDKINASFLAENKKPGLAEKISVWIRGNFFIPDARRFWIRPSIKFLNQYIREQQITHVISTGPPHSMHLIALRLKQLQPEIKWLADFRDPWTHIDFYDKLMLTPMADKKHRRLESAVLKNADLVVSVGEWMRDEFAEIYRQQGGGDDNKFRVITNGYDEEDVIYEIKGRDESFSMAHVGTLVRDRNPAVLWKVLSALTRQNQMFREKLQIKLVGKVDVFVKEELDKYKLSRYVKKIDYLPHSEVIAEQQRSKVLLLLVNHTKNARGILTGKFFEYMAARVPIIAIGPEDGDLAKILQETNTGLISGFEDEETLKKNILAYFSGHTTTRNEAQVARYSRWELTRKLCALLDAM